MAEIIAVFDAKEICPISIHVFSSMQWFYVPFCWVMLRHWFPTNKTWHSIWSGLTMIYYGPWSVIPKRKKGGKINVCIIIMLTLFQHTLSFSWLRPVAYNSTGPLCFFISSMCPVMINFTMWDMSQHSRFLFNKQREREVNIKRQR